MDSEEGESRLDMEMAEMEEQCEECCGPGFLCLEKHLDTRIVVLRILEEELTDLERTKEDEDIGGEEDLRGGARGGVHDRYDQRGGEQ